MNINSHALHDFIDKNGGKEKNSSRLFSFSQEIGAGDYHSLKAQTINAKNLLFYSNSPSENFSFIAVGKIYSVINNSAENSERLEKEISQLPFKIESNLDDDSNPLFVGGMKFPSDKKSGQWNEFNSEEWSIPRLILLHRYGTYLLILNSFAGETDNAINEANLYLSGNHQGSAAPVDSVMVKRCSGFFEWKEQIERALSEISEKKLKKVVLSRFKILELKEKPLLSSLLAKLENCYENCTTFAYKSGSAFFFGATPEKLFKVNKGYINCTALAGSIRRGKNKEEDRRLENELLHDKKNLKEHKSVVDYIFSNIEPLTEKAESAPEPVIKKFANIQHLFTPLSGKLKQGVSFFTALKKIFPTPAVCGYPKNEAVELINKLENFDRGMFAGVIGWFNLNGCADISVGIRAAFLRENILIAYAGCGIVAGSDPESEFNETNLKLKPILNLFADENFDKP